MVGTRRLSTLAGSMIGRLRLPDAPLIVALSGGADSAALAHLTRHRTLRAVHVDHGLVNSEMMRNAAIAVADTLDLDLETVSVVVADGPSPEGQARRARYLALAGVATDRAGILTAHTKDDDVETVLLNLVRGTGSKGLGGIPYYRPPNVFRPMLEVTRSETRELATLAGLPFVDDPMNDDPGLTRNIVRSRMLPILTELNPQIVDSVSRMAGAVQSDNSHLDWLAAQIPLLHGDDTVAVALGDLLTTPKPVGDRVLKTMLEYAVGSERVTALRVQGLWSVVNRSSQSFELAPEVVAKIRGPMLVIETPPDWIDNQTVDLGPGRHRVARLEFDVVLIDGVCRVAPLSKWAALFPKETILQVRPDGMVTADGEPAWIPGDRRFPISWYEPGSIGYLSVFATEVTGWISSH